MKNSNSKRLNKYISESGSYSRREADRMIEEGRVTINGKIPELGTQVQAGDIVRVDGSIIDSKDAPVYIALNKPVGIVSTTDQNEKDNIVDFILYPTRIFPIGRLDKDSQGLILLTNDGDIVNKILRASNNHEKEYIVTVHKPITEDFIAKMGSGVPILGQVTKKCFVSKITENQFKIVLTQGLNRQIRRMCEYFGYNVTSLKRVRVLNITLKDLPVGEWRELSEKEIETINNLVESSSKISEPKKINAITKKKSFRPNQKQFGKSFNPAKSKPTRNKFQKKKHK